MARIKNSKTGKVSKVRNAGPAMQPSGGPRTLSARRSYGASEDSPAADGTRSLPSQVPWNATLTLHPGRNRQRVETARALDELFPLCGYLNKMLPEEALGNGMVVSSLSTNPDFRRKANAAFDLWGSSNKIDVRGEVNIYSCQSMLGHYVARDGEMFALKIKSANPQDYKRSLTDKSFRSVQLQFIRRDQIGTFGIGQPNLGAPGNPIMLARWDDGIFLDDLDRAKIYRILQRQNGTITPQKYYEVDASRMIHIKEGSLEGIHGQPMCFRGQDTCIDALDLRALSKYADKIRACFLGVIQTESGEMIRSMRNNVKPGRKVVVDPETHERTVKDNKGVRHYEIAGGVFIPVLSKDEKISFFTGQSNLTFGEQIVMLFREVLFSYMVPPEYVLEINKLGSAAARLILRKIRKLLDRVRRPFSEIFLQQVWEHVVSDLMLPHYVYDKGRIVETIPAVLPMVDDWNVIQCKAAPDPSIDAGRDEKAEQEKLRTFTGTVGEYCDALGKDGEQVRHARLEEIRDNIEHGAKLNLPWFLCVDPAILQSLSGIAKGIGPDIEDLTKLLQTEKED